MSFKLESYKPLTGQNVEFFNKYKESVDSQIREKHSGIPDDFDLKPVSMFITPISGLDHTYKVAVPNNQFVKVRFLAGDIATSFGPPEVSFHVADTLTSADDDK